LHSSARRRTPPVLAFSKSFLAGSPTFQDPVPKAKTYLLVSSRAPSSLPQTKSWNVLVSSTLPMGATIMKLLVLSPLAKMWRILRVLSASSCSRVAHGSVTKSMGGVPPGGGGFSGSALGRPEATPNAF
jgi:hypothetical protein